MKFSTNDGTLLRDLPHSIYDFRGKLCPIGIENSPQCICSINKKGAPIWAERFSNSNFDNRFIRIFPESNNIVDAKRLVFVTQTVNLCGKVVDYRRTAFCALDNGWCLDVV